MGTSKVREMPVVISYMKIQDIYRRLAELIDAKVRAAAIKINENFEIIINLDRVNAIEIGFGLNIYMPGVVIEIYENDDGTLGHIIHQSNEGE